MIGDIKETISNMTLEEKARLVNGATFFGTQAFPGHQIPRMQLLDGATGMNLEQLFGDLTQNEIFCSSDEFKEMYGADAKPRNMIGSTPLVHVIEHFFEPELLKEDELPLYRWIKKKMDERLGGADYAPGCYPPGILLGATWNPEVVHKVGQALGMECCLYGVHMLLGPNVNILRDPRNGRLFEGYSEDPYLVSHIAPEMVKGIQEYGVSATVKHYVANNQETNRLGINENISARALEEVYFPGFKACVTEGKTKAVMNAYNDVNKEACTESTWLLRQKLRDEFGFDGVVVSDWGAARRSVLALRGGTNLAMPGPIDYRPIYDAVKDGSLDEADLDDAVEHILNVWKWIEENHREDLALTYGVDAIKEFTDRAAYEAACEGIVLLKNDRVCPMAKGTKLAVLGTGADQMLECGSGSAGIDTSRHGDVKGELRKYFTVVNELATCDYAIVVCVLPGMEGNDRDDLFLSKEDLAAIKKVKDAGKDCILILNTCGPVDLSAVDDDSVKAIVATFLPGMGGAHALADILAGVVNPSGKLSLCFPEYLEQTPSYLNFPGDGFHVNYGEGIYVGYRYYTTKCIKPKYAFGFGLSYTEFEKELLSAVFDKAENKVIVQTRIKNIGSVDGAEVLQIYVHDVVSHLSKPKKELKAFQKVKLKAGEERFVTFEISVESLASYDPNLSAWATEEGVYQIILATSSADEDICGCKDVYVDVKSPYSYSIKSQIKEIYESQELKEILFELWTKQGWDVAAIENNYQYSSHRMVEEALGDLDEHVASPEQKQAFIDAFNHIMNGKQKP